ncbi:MAG: VanZ family protein [Chloroflexi bacterium]|nr:VanZ family protein [Chloroflexota bacterium]MCC6895893.1 VanZ family protein [Anaerolineae bacterium]
MDTDLYPYLSMGVEFTINVVHLWLPAIVIFIALTAVIWLRKRSLSYVLCFLIFGAYLLYTVDKVFFPIPVSGTYADVMKQAPWTAFINYIPFYFGPFSNLEDSLNTLLLNVILTIPFGFGINFLIPTQPRKMLRIAIAVGIGIEATQFIIGLLIGYFYRYVDINDILMNALGVLVGYVIFRVFAWLYLWAAQKLDMQLEGLAGYIHDVASQAAGQQIPSP